MATSHPPVAVTVDLVVLTVRDDRLQALTVRRGEEPYAGQWALPGGFVRPDEDLAPPRVRELGEETGLTADRSTSSSSRPTAPPTATRGCGRDGRLPRPRRRPAGTHRRQRRGRRAWQPVDDLVADPDRSPSTTRRSCATASSGPAPSSSTRRSRPPSARRSSPSASCGGSTRRSGARPSTRATSTARSRRPPASSSRPARRPRATGAGPHSCFRGGTISQLPPAADARLARHERVLPELRQVVETVRSGR